MNVKLLLMFDGTKFFGWQALRKEGKPSLPAVQDVLQDALVKVYKEPIKLMGCSRTDRDVSAKYYCAHFNAPFNIEEDALVRAINSIMPWTVRVFDASYVSDEFHSRYTSKSKIYIYRIYNPFKKHDYPLFDEYCFYVPNELDYAKMKEAIKIFKGTHDFRAYSLCDTDKFADKNTECEVLYAQIRRYGKYIYFIIKGNRFLHRMVRFIVGAVLGVGKSNLNIDDLRNNLENKKRSCNIKVVDGKGLFLKRVLY